MTKPAEHLQVFVQADYSRGREGQRQEVGEGEPEPELGEDEQAHHWRHVSVTRPGLQRDGHVTSTWAEGKRSDMWQTQTINAFNVIY